MGTFYRHVWQNGGTTTSECWAYVDVLPRSYMESISPIYGFFVAPEVSEDMVAEANANTIGALRVLGRLTGAQQSLLESGGVGNGEFAGRGAS